MNTYKNGKFSSLFDSSKNIRLWHILKWKFFKHPKDIFRSEPVLPLVVEHDSQGLHQKEDFICWLSHASFLIQLGGKRLLIDPVFGNIPFYKRQIKVPYRVDELGAIDYLLVSHTHYDHCDENSISALSSQNVKAVVPLKMTKLLHKMNPDMLTKELDWYEDYTEGELTITLLPSKHWGRRGIFDKNAVLWGGYLIRYQDKSIYFAGDTAWDSHFEAIGNRYTIDTALLPIGAYEPDYIMKENHLNPKEAFDAFKALKAKRMIPMHYGTFKLTDEPLDEPLKWMQDIAEDHPNQISFMHAGEVMTLEEDKL